MWLLSGKLEGEVQDTVTVGQLKGLENDSELEIGMKYCTGI